MYVLHGEHSLCIEAVEVDGPVGLQQASTALNVQGTAVERMSVAGAARTGGPGWLRSTFSPRSWLHACAHCCAGGCGEPMLAQRHRASGWA